MSNLAEITLLQKTFLSDLINKKAPVAVYLKNGVKLKGTLKSFDKHCLLLDHPNQQVIYLSAVSTIAPLLMFETFVDT